MNPTLTLPTEQETVELRQLTIEHAPAYFKAVNASREHLSQFGDTTVEKYPTLESVEESITNPSNPDKLRMGIWDGDAFVGSINLTPNEDGRDAEIGYWLDTRQTGKGYATVAAKALANYAKNKFPKLHAEVVEGNTASVSVLERAGFQQTASEAGRLTFELIKQSAPQRITHDEAEKFERDGFDGFIYVPKEAGAGFTALEVDVHGSHQRKRMLEGTTRSYYVSKGTGTFTIGDETFEVKEGDLYVIPAGGEYEYQGEMTLLEFNVSPDNSFRDQKLD